MKKRIFINWLREIFCPKTIKKESEDSKEIRMKRTVCKKNNYYSFQKNTFVQGARNNRSHSSRKK